MKFKNKREARIYCKRYWSDFLRDPKIKKLDDAVKKEIHKIKTKITRCLVSFPLSDEYSIIQMLHQIQPNWQIYLPRIIDQADRDMVFSRVYLSDLASQDKKEYTLHRHSLGFFEPSEDSVPVKLPLNVDTDLILVPVLGLTSDGFRLGRGQGYYDRYVQGLFLNKSSFTSMAILPRALSLLDFPKQQYDMHIDIIVTENC